MGSRQSEEARNSSVVTLQESYQTRSIRFLELW
jgi:hypothetical protein